MSRSSIKPVSSKGCQYSATHEFQDSFEGVAPSPVDAASASLGICVLDEAYRSHGATLLRYLRCRAGPDDAPDLMQEVFLRAANSPQRNKLDNPGGFLRRIAQNLLIDFARRRKKPDAAMLPLDEGRDAVSQPEQELELEAADLLRLYERAVGTLPEKTRRVFLMHRVEELSYREIHERLGISIATVEYHMMKALAQIANVVDGGR